MLSRIFNYELITINKNIRMYVLTIYIIDIQKLTFFFLAKDEMEENKENLHFQVTYRHKITKDTYKSHLCI